MLIQKTGSSITRHLFWHIPATCAKREPHHDVRPIWQSKRHTLKERLCPKPEQPCGRHSLGMHSEQKAAPLGRLAFPISARCNTVPHLPWPSLVITPDPQR